MKTVLTLFLLISTYVLSAQAVELPPVPKQYDIVEYNNNIPVKTGYIKEDLNGNYNIFKYDNTTPVRVGQVRQDNMDNYNVFEYKTNIPERTIQIKPIEPVKLYYP